MHDEVRDADRRVRPDYGVSVNQIVMGYVEVKAPGKSIKPESFSGHNLEQWERQKDLPNLIYTNGTDWRLYVDGNLRIETSLSPNPLLEIRGNLRSNPDFEILLRLFLEWKVVPITSVQALVRAIAPLTRLLRGEVLDQLAAERRRVDAGSKEDEQPFIGLSRDWRRLLFPQADDKTFADGYAQAVTFALLLARTSNIGVEGRSLHDVGKDLGAQHSLMGRALQLLTDDVEADFKVTLDLLVTVIGAVQWARIRKTKRDVYLYLYEEFLAEYDDALRQASGTYYTPKELVDQMVRLTQSVLVDTLGIEEGFASNKVFTVDPAMGTGTFLQSIIEAVRVYVAEDGIGVGGVGDAMTGLAERLAGFELQMGPYAVAELRVAELLAQADAKLPKGGLKLYVTDTLDDPESDQTQIASGLQTIANSRKRANELKRSQKVNVVIGNPPYRELTAGLGGWVEHGSLAAKRGKKSQGILQDFLKDVPGNIAAKLKNLYVYFWRWSTWKVWESTVADETGVICLITTSGYVTGSAFKSMRRYLREQATEGWIIDLTPEGHTPDVPTRIFPGVRQPLAIGIFVRTPGADAGIPAKIRYVALHGKRHQKFEALRTLELGEGGWQDVRTQWTAAFTPAPTSEWDQWPSLDQLFAWYRPGIFTTRTWVYSPSTDVLDERWKTMVSEPNVEQRTKLVKDKRGEVIDKQFKDLPGFKHEKRLSKLSSLTSSAAMEPAVRVGYRAFDRQYLIADPRLIHRAGEDLWNARELTGQVFIVEQHVHAVGDGPGLLFSGLMPDNDHFNNRGGRTLPFIQPDGTPNLADGLVLAISKNLNAEVTARDVLDYTAGVVAHPNFTERFADELDTPGIRVPLTADVNLFRRAVELGRQVVWAQTFGAVGGDGAPPALLFPKDDPRRITLRAGVKDLPERLDYDIARQEILIGGGRFGPVSQEVYEYAVGGRSVVKSWVDYRAKAPAGKRTSPLDEIVPSAWEPEWSHDLVEVLTVLTRLIELESAQGELLSQILESALLTCHDLETAGAKWPTSDQRRPRPASETTLDLWGGSAPTESAGGTTTTESA
ncbi:N-6 DNA methylase [Microbacterium lacus]|uniref:type ISP restriction/modification enzyme n=1 Tax=Microbacterium lacus TaxID=415217 RepID=UPI00384CDB8C